MNDTEAAAWGGAVAVLVILALLPAIIVYHAFMLAIIWNWYAPHLGLPELTTSMAVGVMCIKAMLFLHTESKNGDVGLKLLASIAIAPLFMLLIAFIGTLFLA